MQPLHMRAAQQPSAPTKRPAPSVEADFECPVCCDMLLDPVVAPCGHDICNGCYRRWLKRFGGAPACCPLCRQHMPSGLAVCLRLKRTIKALHPDGVKRRRIEAAAEEAEEAATGRDHYAGCTILDGLSATYPVMGSYPAEVVGHCVSALMYMTANMMGGQWQAASEPAAQHSALCADDESPRAASNNGGNTEAGEERWQRASDSAARLTIARGIVDTLRTCGVRPAADSKFVSAVRVLELVLYRSAPSKEAYLNRATLRARVHAAVRQRLANRSASAAGPGPSLVLA